MLNAAVAVCCILELLRLTALGHSQLLLLLLLLLATAGCCCLLLAANGY